jgi:octaprenyl-diphosphate synthase
VTLQLIFALEAEAGSNGHSGEGRRMVAKVLEERGFLSVKPEQITKLVQDTSALNRASSLAREYVCRAKTALGELPDSEYRRALLAVPDFILDRKN